MSGAASGGAGGIDPVPSPCVGVCRVDAASNLCVGCLRTLEEIAVWASLSERDRRAVWSEIARRGERLRGVAAARAGPAKASGLR